MRKGREEDSLFENWPLPRLISGVGLPVVHMRTFHKLVENGVQSVLQCRFITGFPFSLFWLPQKIETILFGTGRHRNSTLTTAFENAIF
jgi:hypothetical protein